ncbi:MAG TPA: peptide deformylase [Polyangiaceae bacterium]|jgi:peptide deformylase
MSILKIAQMGEPVLRKPTQPVAASDIGSPKIERLIDDMIETMRDADGAGLAAPQIYEPLRLCVIEVNQNPRYPSFPSIPLTILINPVLRPEGPVTGPLSPEDSISMYEGCLSVTGIRGRVQRPRRVQVRALDRQGRPLEFVWEGVRAAVVQHETDHLDGILFVDRVDTKTLTFLREYERHVPLAERLVDGIEPRE